MDKLWKCLVLLYIEAITAAECRLYCYYNSYYYRYYCYYTTYYSYHYYYYSNGGLIAGVVVGAVVGLAILIGLIFFCCVAVCKPKTQGVRGTVIQPATVSYVGTVQPMVVSYPAVQSTVQSFPPPPAYGQQDPVFPPATSRNNLPSLHAPPAYRENVVNGQPPVATPRLQ